MKTNGAISFGARTIAPFSADVDTRKGGNVSYRGTTDKELLHRATDEVKAYFPEFMKFRASWIFIATWNHVAFYNCFEEGCSKVMCLYQNFVSKYIHLDFEFFLMFLYRLTPFKLS